MQSGRKKILGLIVTIELLLVTMFIFDINNSIFIMNVIDTKKAILNIWNNIDIRNTCSDIKNEHFY